MLKNKKGFTFIEILAAITILGILTGIGVVSVSSIIENGKNEHYETAEENLSLAGQSYVQTNRAALPKAIGQKTKIKLSTLVEKNYIQPIKDYSDNECDLEDSYVQVFKYSQKDYSYVPVLKCGTDGNVYDGTKDSATTYDPEITAQIVVDEEKSSAEAQVTIQGNDKLMSYSYIVYRGTKEVKNSGSVSVKGFKESVSFKIPLTDYTPGKLKVVIAATNIYGNDDTLTVTKTVADTKAPTCIIKLEDETTTAKEWVSGTRKITVGCEDGDGSGCTRESYSKTFRKTTKNGEIIIADEAGNSTVCNVSVYLDNTAPKCTVSGGNASWINATTTAQKRTITAKCDDGKDEKGKPQSGCKVVTQTKVYSSNIDTTTAGVLGDGEGGYVEDMVGNRTNCQANQTVKIDKNPPSCSVSGGSTSWINATSSPTKRTITATCTDTGGSGCAVASFSKDYSSNINTTKAGAKGDNSGGSVKDKAGNETACAANQTVKIDKNAPTCTNGGDSTTWTNSNRKITYGCSDTGGSKCNSSYSGGSTTFSSSTKTSTIASYTIKDTAGNTVTCPSRTANVYVDKTAPSCTNSGDSTTWTNSNRKITYGCSDSHSGCNSSYSGGSKTFSSTTKTSSIASYTIKDQVGNSTTCAARTANVYVDKTAPSCTNSGDSTSWTNSDRTISYGCSDSHSGCNSSYDGGSKKFTSTTKTSSIAAYTIKDQAGNSTSCAARTANVYVDKTKPTCTASGGSTSWTKNNRTITYGCSDSDSGCNSSYSGGSKTFSSTTKTATIAAYTIKDKAGNSTSCASTTANVYVDKTKPTCTNSGDSTSWTNSDRTITYGCSDSHSGCNTSYDGGSKTFSSTTKTSSIASYTIKDKVGNSVTCDARTANVYVDKTAPSCTNSGDSTSWTSGNRTINYGCSDSHSGCNTSYDGGSKTFSSSTKTSTIAAYTIKDKAGNSKSCAARTANVYVDKTAPSCGTISGASTSYTTGSRKVSVACSDSHSGCTKSSFSKTWSSGTVTTDTITLKDNVGHTKNCTVNVYRKDISVSFSGYMGYWVAAEYKNDCSKKYRALNSSGNCILTYGNKYASNVIKATASKSGLKATFTWTVVNGAQTYIGAGHYTNLILKNSSGTVLKKVAAKEPRNPLKWATGGTYSGSFSYTFSSAGTYYLYMDGDTTDPNYDVTLGTITVS